MFPHTLLLISLLGQTQLAAPPTRPIPGAQSYGGSSQPYLNGASLPGGMALEAAPGGRARFQAALRVEEMTGKAATDELATIDVDFGKATFAERWLIETLRTRFSSDRLDHLEMVETLTGRPVGNSIVLRRVRALEGNGSVDAVNEATSTIERFLAMNESLLEVEITVAMSKVENDDGAEVRVTPLDTKALEAKRAEFSATDGKFSVIMAPKLAVYGGQRGEVRVQNEEKYISDWELLESGGKKRAFPVVSKLPSGIEFSIQAVVDPERSTVRSELALEMRELARPVRTFKSTLENGESVQVDLPEWTTTSWSSADLETSSVTPGFMITGLRTWVIDTDANSREQRDLTILGSIKKLAGLGEITTATSPQSTVLGFDPATQKVFVQNAGKHATSDRIMFERAGGAGVVGSGVVVSIEGSVMIVELKSGETAAGDIAR